jgi:hypothetical protein
MQGGDLRVQLSLCPSLLSKGKCAIHTGATIPGHHGARDHVTFPRRNRPQHSSVSSPPKTMAALCGVSICCDGSHSLCVFPVVLTAMLGQRCHVCCPFCYKWNRGPAGSLWLMSGRTRVQIQRPDPYWLHLGIFLSQCLAPRQPRAGSIIPWVSSNCVTL